MSFSPTRSSRRWDGPEQASSNFAASRSPARHQSIDQSRGLYCGDLLASPTFEGHSKWADFTIPGQCYRGAITDFNDRLHNYIASHGHRIAVVDINQLLIEIVTARALLVEVSE